MIACMLICFYIVRVCFLRIIYMTFIFETKKKLFLERNYFAYFTEDSHSSNVNKPHVCLFFLNYTVLKKIIDDNRFFKSL